MELTKKISGGLYLVVDPSLGMEKILPALQQAISGGIDVLQIWNNWNNGQDKQEVINAICSLANAANIPVIINEEWELLVDSPLDGVHFDNPPQNLHHIRETIGRKFICGITCGNDLSRVTWADKNNLDYISFCSLFPSASAGVCEIVRKETVQEARQITELPIFLAGGITTDNINELTGTGMNGIAVISAIMKAGDPLRVTESFKNKLKTINNETITH